MRILLIDDDTALLPRLAQIIEAEGYAVDTAAEGMTGIRLAIERRPACFIPKSRRRTESIRP